MEGHAYLCICEDSTEHSVLAYACSMNIREVSEHICILDFSLACVPKCFVFLSTNAQILAYHVCMFAAHVNEVTVDTCVRSTEFDDLRMRVCSF